MRLVALIFAMAAATMGGGCAPGSQAGKQAGQGATLGAVGGAVAGAVGSLLWGGNVAEGAAKGAAMGAASGAAAGAVSGSMSDGAAKEKADQAAEADPKLQALRKRIGDRNYASTLLLAQCRHQDAIASARETLAATEDPGERDYAMLLQGIAAEESGDKTLATSLYPEIAKAKGGSADKVRADALEGVIKVQGIRREHGLPACK